MKFVAQTIFEVLGSFEKSQQKNSLSAVVLLTYLLNSLVHAPPPRMGKVNYNKIKKFIEQERCKKNDLLFIPSLFALHNNKFLCDFILEDADLQGFFPKITINDQVYGAYEMDHLNIESPVLARLGDCTTTWPNVSRFHSIHDLELYSREESYTRDFAGYAQAIFQKFGLSDKAVLLFLQVIFGSMYSRLQ